MLMLIDASLFAFMISSITSLVRYGMASYPSRHGIASLMGMASYPSRHGIVSLMGMASYPGRHGIVSPPGMESQPITLGLLVQCPLTRPCTNVVALRSVGGKCHANSGDYICICVCLCVCACV